MGARAVGARHWTAVGQKMKGQKMEIWKSISCYFFAQPFFAHLEIGVTWDPAVPPNGARHKGESVRIYLWDPVGARH